MEFSQTMEDESFMIMFDANGAENKLVILQIPWLKRACIRWTCCCPLGGIADALSFFLSATQFMQRSTATKSLLSMWLFKKKSWLQQIEKVSYSTSTMQVYMLQKLKNQNAKAVFSSIGSFGFSFEQFKMTKICFSTVSQNNLRTFFL